MPTMEASNRRLQELAGLIERDIRTRGLRPGDRYLTTLEVAELLGVSTRFANDAMRLLAARQVLVRKPKAGTLIGPRSPGVDEDEASRPFDVVHLLIRQDYYFSERRRMESVIAGLAEELAGCSIQLNFVPAFNELAYVERLLDAPPTPRNAYLIAVKSTQVQRRFENQRAPTVLLGTPYDGISRLAWVDKDQAQIGRLLSRRLLEMGHKRIGVILRDRRGYGDDLLMDAVTHEIMDAGLGSGALVARSVPTEPALIALAIRNLLASPQRPTALICRNRMILNTALQVCGELGLQPGGDVGFALCDAPSGADDVVPVACIRPRVDLDAAGEGRLLGKLLVQQAESSASTVPPHVLVPVTL